VDPIEKEEDRNKALATINTLLEKADKDNITFNLYKGTKLSPPSILSWIKAG